MADVNAIRSGEDKLRRRLSSALREERGLSGIASELIQWQLKGWGPILFGGFLRDLMVFGLKKMAARYRYCVSVSNNRAVGTRTLRRPILGRIALEGSIVS